MKIVGLRTGHRAEARGRGEIGATLEGLIGVVEIGVVEIEAGEIGIGAGFGADEGVGWDLD
jgi:hypothetical protein